MKNPLVLFSISSLCRAFEEWIPKLHGATKSCLELNKNSDGNNTNIDLKYFLDGPAFADVSYLARMCFDCGVYGLEGMEPFQDVFCNATSSSETSSSGSLVVQDNAEVTDVKDDISNVLESTALETVMEHEVDECTPSTSHEDVETTDESIQAGFSDGSTSHSDAATSPSISTNVDEESFKAKTLDSDSGDVLGNAAVDVNSGSVEPLKASPHEDSGTLYNSTDTSVFSHEELSSNPSLAQKKRSSLHSTPNCELICLQCKNGTAFCSIDIGEVNTESSAQQQIDSIRSKFLAFYFFLLDVKQLRRTLFMSRGDRRRTWNTFVDCLSGECFMSGVFISSFLTLM